MRRYEVIVQPEAQAEIEAIRKYQNEIDPKRARRFLLALEECLRELGDLATFQKRKRSFRHVMLKELPYRVVFEIEGDKVFIYQVRHTSQRPSKRFGP